MIDKLNFNCPLCNEQYYIDVNWEYGGSLLDDFDIDTKITKNMFYVEMQSIFHPNIIYKYNIKNYLMLKINKKTFQCNFLLFDKNEKSVKVNSELKEMIINHLHRLAFDVDHACCINVRISNIGHLGFIIDKNKILIKLTQNRFSLSKDIKNIEYVYENTSWFKTGPLIYIYNRMNSKEEIEKINFNIDFKKVVELFNLNDLDFTAKITKYKVLI